MLSNHFWKKALELCLVSLVVFLAIPSFVNGVKVTCPINHENCPQTNGFKEIMERATSRKEVYRNESYRKEDCPNQSDACYETLLLSTRKNYFYDENGDLTFNGWVKGHSERLPIFQDATGNNRFTMRVCLESGKDTKMDSQCPQGFVFCFTGQLDPSNAKIKSKFHLPTHDGQITQDCNGQKNAPGVQHGFSIAIELPNVNLATSFSDIPFSFKLPEDRCFHIHFGGEGTSLTTVTTTSNQPVVIQGDNPMPDLNNGVLLREAENPVSLLHMDMATYQSGKDLWISSFGRNSTDYSCRITARILALESVKPCKSFFMDSSKSPKEVDNWYVKADSTEPLIKLVSNTKTLMDEGPSANSRDGMQIWFYCNGSLMPYLEPINANNKIPTPMPTHGLSSTTAKTSSTAKTTTTSKHTTRMTMTSETTTHKPLPKFGTREPNSTALPKLIPVTAKPITTTTSEVILPKLGTRAPNSTDLPKLIPVTTRSTEKTTSKSTPGVLGPVGTTTSSEVRDMILPELGTVAPNSTALPKLLPVPSKSTATSKIEHGDKAHPLTNDDLREADELEKKKIQKSVYL